VRSPASSDPTKAGGSSGTHAERAAIRAHFVEIASWSARTRKRGHALLFELSASRRTTCPTAIAAGVTVCDLGGLDDVMESVLSEVDGALGCAVADL
jgi:hypothetical protein